MSGQTKSASSLAKICALTCNSMANCKHPGRCQAMSERALFSSQPRRRMLAGKPSKAPESGYLCSRCCCCCCCLGGGCDHQFGGGRSRQCGGCAGHIGACHVRGIGRVEALCHAAPTKELGAFSKAGNLGLSENQSGYGSKLNHQRTAGFSPCFHLPGFHFAHSQVKPNLGG